MQLTSKKNLPINVIVNLYLRCRLATLWDELGAFCKHYNRQLLGEI